ATKKVLQDGSGWRVDTSEAIPIFNTAWIPFVGEEQKQIVCCSLWAIRSETNRRVHDKVVKSGKEITNFISRYLYELDCVEEKKITVQGDKVIWNPPPTDFIKVNFDTAFVMERCRLGTGQVARNSKGVVIASKTCTTMWDRLSPGKPLHALRRLKWEGRRLLPDRSAPESAKTTFSDDWLREPD
ncbi:hypothetical protein Godav_013650, partial [Gossypium davidsonii]|nr:hypothetical protein [Gossypium davidsonii]